MINRYYTLNESGNLISGITTKKKTSQDQLKKKYKKQLKYLKKLSNFRQIHKVMPFHEITLLHIMKTVEKSIKDYKKDNPKSEIGSLLEIASQAFVRGIYDSPLCFISTIRYKKNLEDEITLNLSDPVDMCHSNVCKRYRQTTKESLLLLDLATSISTTIVKEVIQELDKHSILYAANKITVPQAVYRVGSLLESDVWTIIADFSESDLSMFMNYSEHNDFLKLLNGCECVPYLCGYTTHPYRPIPELILIDVEGLEGQYMTDIIYKPFIVNISSPLDINKTKDIADMLSISFSIEKGNKKGRIYKIEGV